MSEEQLKAFIAKAKNDQSIQEKLKAAKSPEDVVAIAKDHGHEFTGYTLKQTELTEADLEGVAGGGFTDDGGIDEPFSTICAGSGFTKPLAWTQMAGLY